LGRVAIADDASSETQWVVEPVGFHSIDIAEGKMTTWLKSRSLLAVVAMVVQGLGIAAAAEPPNRSGGATTVPAVPDGALLLNAVFGVGACALPGRLCLGSALPEQSAGSSPCPRTDPGWHGAPNSCLGPLSYEVAPDRLMNRGAPETERGVPADRRLFLTRGDSGGPRANPEQAFAAAAQNIASLDYLNALGSELAPLTGKPVELRVGGSSPYWGVSAIGWQHGLKDGEEQTVYALYVETGTSKDRPFGDRSLAHLLSTYTKGGENIEYDVLLPSYVEQLRKGLPEGAKETPVKGGATLFSIETPRESVSVLVGLESRVDNATRKPVPGSTRLFVMKSVFSWDALKKARNEAVQVESANWLERRMEVTGMSSKEDLFAYELAAAKKLTPTDPARALSNLASLAFFPEANTVDALAIKKDALTALEAKQRAEKAESDRRAAAELAARAKRDAAARKAQAEAAAKSKALLAGVNQDLTPEGALFDIGAAKGQLVIWQGSLMKNLFGTTYLASTGGVFWCLRLSGKAAGPGYFVAKGTVTGACKITDGIRDLTVPQLDGAFVDLP
jgi:hypothetical protein